MSEQTARPTVEAVAQAIESYIKRATIPAGNIFREPVGVTPTQVARAVLALLPGRPESVVKLEALQGLLDLCPTQSGTPAGDAHDRGGWGGLVRWYMGEIEADR